MKIVDSSALFIKRTYEKKRNESLIKNKRRFRYEPDALLLELIDFYVKSSRITYRVYMYFTYALVFVTLAYLISIDVIIPCRMTFK